MPTTRSRRLAGSMPSGERRPSPVVSSTESPTETPRVFARSWPSTMPSGPVLVVERANAARLPDFMAR